MNGESKGSNGPEFEPFNIDIVRWQDYDKSKDLCIGCARVVRCSHKAAANDPKYRLAGLKAYVDLCSERRISEGAI